MITREILLNILTDKEKYNLIIKDYSGLYSSIITINQNKSEDNVNNAIKKIFDFIEKNSKFELVDYCFVTYYQYNNNLYQVSKKRSILFCIIHRNLVFT